MPESFGGLSSKESNIGSPFKIQLGGGTPGIPFRVLFSSLWGRLNTGFVGPPPAPFKVGGMIEVSLMHMDKMLLGVLHASVAVNENSLHASNLKATQSVRRIRFLGPTGAERALLRVGLYLILCLERFP